MQHTDWTAKAKLQFIINSNSKFTSSHVTQHTDWTAKAKLQFTIKLQIHSFPRDCHAGPLFLVYIITVSKWLGVLHSVNWALHL